MTPTHIIVPRFYGIAHFGIPRKDNTSRGTPLQGVRFNGRLSEEQMHVATSVADRFGVTLSSSSPFPRGGLVVLPCGWGKTVLALYVAAVLTKVKTVVLVHKQGLLEQWCDRVRQYLPDATVGVLQQDRIDVDADILVAMIQSVAKRNYSSHLKDRGLVIVDECHHLGAPVFGTAMAKISAAWTLGLSATPERKDGLTSILFMTMGEIICRIERKQEPAFVTSVVFDEKVTQHEVLSGNGRPMYAAMVNHLTINTRRNSVLATHIARLHRAGRKILVLSERIRQLEALHSMLVKNEGIDETEVGFYIGPSTPAERERCSVCSIMLSTYQMAREGMDQKHLNALCLASPTSDLTQAVGRVQRTCGRERIGPPPLILDACDTFSIFQHQAKKRRRFFQTAGFTLQRWTASTGRVITEGDETKTQLFV